MTAITEPGQSPGSNLRRGVRLRVLISMLLIGSVLTGITMATFLLIRQEYRGHARSMEQQAVTLYRSIIDSYFEHFSADLAYLVNTPELAGWLAAAEGAPPAAIIERFSELSRSHDVYASISLLDRTGQGLLRIENHAGVLRVARRDALPDFGRSNFFRKILAGDLRSVYISAAGRGPEDDPDNPGGQPQLRLVAPVHHPGGERIGLIAMTYSGAAFTTGLRQSADISLGDLMLLDAEGNWLLLPYPDTASGAVRAEPRRGSFGSAYPAIWLAMLKTRSGQIDSRHGLFTFAAIRPYVQLPHEPRDQVGSRLYDASTAYRLSVVSFVPRERMLAALAPIRDRFVVLNAVLLFLSALVAGLLGHSYRKRREALIRLDTAAHFDFLTGLANRALFTREFSQALTHARRYGQILALLLLDLDAFKRINDNLGHEAGDRLLAETARRLRLAVRESDLVARIGGDEFTVILAGIHALRDAELIARKIREALNLPFRLAGTECSIRCSIGLSIYPQDGTTAQQLLQQADQAMYTVKNAGGNGYRHQPAAPGKAPDRLPGVAGQPDPAVPPRPGG